VWIVLVPEFLESIEESDGIVELKESDDAALLLVDSCDGCREVVASVGDWMAGTSMCSMLGNSG
jgi:hypothetical protein